MPHPRPSRQLPLEFSHEPAATRDDLVVGDANRAAVDLVDRWPDWPARVAAIVGPPGSGKSHLAAIWRNRAGALDASRLAVGEVSQHAPALLPEHAATLLPHDVEPPPHGRLAAEEAR